MASRLRSRQVRIWVGWLLLPGLALRLLLPPGFMPGGAGDGGHLIKMCHGTGPVPMAVHTPVDDPQPAPSGGQHHEAPCVFAAAGSVAPPTIDSLAVAPPSATDYSPPVPQRSAERRALHRAHLARGPPALFLTA